MAISFNESQTKINLMRAFAGESQARNRYYFAAEEAKCQKLEAVEKIFIFTAEQEMAHAEIFYNHLKEFNGENIEIDAAYPVNNTNSILELLKSAVHNEMEEYSDAYKHFAQTAEKEGFAQIAFSFYKIAEIEKTHAERFQKVYNLLEKKDGTLAESGEYWMCLNCGHIHKGDTIPENCPVCSHNKGYFINLSDKVALF